MRGDTSKSLSSQLCRLSLQNEEYRRENIRLDRTIKYLQHKQNKCTHPDVTSKVDFFFMFPEEIWPYILTYLPNSSDLQNLCEASPLMGKTILEKDKSMWFSDQYLQSVANWLSNKELLTCRLVCRKWNLTVEKYLEINEDYPLNYTMQQSLVGVEARFHISPPQLWRPKLDTLYLENTAELNTFLSDAKAHLERFASRGILISRSLGLGSDLDRSIDEDNVDIFHQQIDEYWDAAKALVRIIGREIWKIEMYNDDVEVDPAYFYNSLHALLCNLPNLKTLRIVRDFTPDLAWNAEQHLIYRMGYLPLPSLPYLESLHVLHNIPALLATKIITKYVHQIRKFVVSAAILVKVDEQYLTGFASLIELVIRDCAGDQIEFFRIFWILEKLEAPRLQKLRLFRSWSEKEVVDIDYLFDLLQNQFPRLINLDTHRIKLEGSLQVLKRPKVLSVYTLKVLKIQLRPCVSLDFLFALPLLEELSLRDKQYFDYQNEPQNNDKKIQNHASNSIIDLVKYLPRVYLSNIWEKVPSIRIVNYEHSADRIHKTFTREMYRHLKRN